MALELRKRLVRGREFWAISDQLTGAQLRVCRKYHHNYYIKEGAYLLFFMGVWTQEKKAQKYKKEGKHERYIGRGPSFLLLLLLFLQWHCQYLMPRQLVLFIYNSSCCCCCSCFSCCVRNSSCPEGDDYSSCWLNNRISLLLWVRDQVSFVYFCLSILLLLLEYYLWTESNLTSVYLDQDEITKLQNTDKLI